MIRFFTTVLMTAAMLYGVDQVDIVKQVQPAKTALAVEWSKTPDVTDEQLRRVDTLLRTDLAVLTDFNLLPGAAVAGSAADKAAFYRMQGAVWLISALLTRENGALGATVTATLLAQGSTATRSYHVTYAERYAFMVHKIANDIAEQLGYARAPWMERFVVMAVNAGKRRSDIAIGDYTLTYQKAIITGGMSLFPKWASAAQEGFYYTDVSRKPTLYYYDVYRGTKRPVAASDGMVVCSDTSRDGKKLLLTMAPSGQSDIYILDLATGKQQRVTDYAGVDVSGQFIDNDSRVAFVSDRLGYPTIFATTPGSNAVQQVIFRGKYNTALTAVGKTIVYAGSGEGGYQLYLASTHDFAARQLTTEGRNVFPKISWGGDAVLYIRQAGEQNGLGIVRLPGGENFLFPAPTGRILSIDW